jgi:hypothetical protein
MWPVNCMPAKRPNARVLVFVKGSDKLPFTVATACLGCKTPAHHFDHHGVTLRQPAPILVPMQNTLYFYRLLLTMGKHPTLRLNHGL